MGETGLRPCRERVGRCSPDELSSAHDLQIARFCEGIPKLSMQDNTDVNGNKSYAEKVRDNYETRDLGAIMGRFYSAVSWRET